MVHVFAGICVVLVGLLLVSEWRKWAFARAVSKTGAALAFVAYGVGLGLVEQGLVGWLFLAGLVFSLLGDVLLLSKKNQVFQFGILAFLLAHVAYVAGFASLGVHIVGTIAGGAAVAVFGVVVARRLKPHLHEMAIPVYVYIAVICLMVAMACGLAAENASYGRLGLLGSAIAFFLSDLCVARERFVTTSLVNKAWGLPLYFGAQLAFAWFAAQAIATSS